MGIFLKNCVQEVRAFTVILVLSRGVARHWALLAKWANLLAVWSGGYWLCYVVTYGYNAYFWDNGVAKGLIPAALHWWLFGVLTVCLMMLFSTLLRNYAGVLLSTGAGVLTMYLVGLLPRAKYASPTALMNTATLLVGAEPFARYRVAIWLAVGCCVACVAIAIPVFHKKQL